ncbi:MAG: hypothetical protein HC895_22675 [Leptolyngbyaceae cyanobacterium SM1_3_5]|nr:hypothetical protein [Leptolyngbyaceae cyanobacterium SM1_3_5]
MHRSNPPNFVISGYYVQPCPPANVSPPRSMSTQKMRTQMNFNSEKELQDYCLQVLRSKGMQPKEEVWCNGLRADIVIDRAVIELKKTLTRDNIFQAVGQGERYQKRLRKEELWIVGQLPKDSESARSALHTARELAKEGIRVSFVDRDVYWQEREPNDIYPGFRPQLPQLPRLSFSWLEQYRVAIAVCFIILALLVWDTKDRPAKEEILSSGSQRCSLAATLQGRCETPSQRDVI